MIKITRAPSLDQSDIQYLSSTNSVAPDCTQPDSTVKAKQKKKYFVFRSLELDTESLDGIDELSILGPVAGILKVASHDY